MLITVAPRSPHTFHIPVMGTGFTIDTALRVARYGISSVLSLVDDVLIEQMRKFHAEQAGEPYTEIPQSDEDVRAKRITAYLNLLKRLVRLQFHELQESAFVRGSEITRYFELLPDCTLKVRYREMLATRDHISRMRLEARLREAVKPGSIDVNIMSKNDRDEYRRGEKRPPEFAAAMAALRGFANSDLQSSVVFSAGMNPRLYNYLPQFDDFFPNATGVLRKTIVLKVSDYRSALVQGKYLAKKGVWVSEFRIESGLNCGGHAFASQGFLLGPILHEFQARREELNAELFRLYAPVWQARGIHLDSPLRCRITVQGGIGTAEEDRMLRDFYGVDATGWATPFLLVPEVANLDEEHRRKLEVATEHDVYLSNSSPFGMPFWNLRGSASETARQARIDQGTPGTFCPKGYITTNNEFTRIPVCSASRAYQKRKLRELANADLSHEARQRAETDVLEKSCICHDLAGAATRLTGIDPNATPAVCVGPNIAYFSRQCSLDEMVAHIYGRASVMDDATRPHFLIRELFLYIDFLQNGLERARDENNARQLRYFEEFIRNLQAGIAYYWKVSRNMAAPNYEAFTGALRTAAQQLAVLSKDTAAAVL